MAEHFFALSTSDKQEAFDFESANQALAAMEIAKMVAEHKSVFFAEKAADGTFIDYGAAISGALRLVPTGPGLEALAADYAEMANDGILLGHARRFEDVMATCAELETRANQTA